MKLVNPMGRQTETGANYDYVTYGGCICSGTTEVANSHNKGPNNCDGFCAYGEVNDAANKELARKKND